MRTCLKDITSRCNAYIRLILVWKIKCKENSGINRLIKRDENMLKGRELGKKGKVTLSVQTMVDSKWWEFNFFFFNLNI